MYFSHSFAINHLIITHHIVTIIIVHVLHIATVAFKFSAAISTSFVHHFIYLFLLFCVVVCVASSMLAR